MQAVELFEAGEMEHLPVSAAASWKWVVCQGHAPLSDKPSALLRQRRDPGPSPRSAAYRSKAELHEASLLLDPVHVEEEPPLLLVL